MVALAYHLFTNQDFYGFEDGKRYNISPLEVFSGVDEAGYQLIKKVIYRRLQFLFISLNYCVQKHVTKSKFSYSVGIKLG